MQINIDKQTITALVKPLKLPTVGQQAISLAEQARKDESTFENYLIQLLEMEVEVKQNRAIQRRLKIAKFPFCKTFDEFDFNLAPHLPATLLKQLAQNNYITEAEPIIFIGEPGTGKSHLAIALGHQAIKAAFSVKFITLSELTNQLIEAKDGRSLSHTINRFAKVDLLIIDEFGYVPLTQVDAELIFQIISQRQEKKPLIITTNLPFSEWMKVIADPRLCKAFIDRVTYKAHIIETGESSIRLSKTLKKRKQKIF